MEKEIKKGKRSEEGKSYTPEEVQKILATTPTGPNWVKPFFQILLATGKRIGEVQCLTWDKISFENKTITIDQMISKEEYHNHLKLEAPPHEIEIDDYLIGIFTELKNHQVAQNNADADWVFFSNCIPSQLMPFRGEHPCPYKSRPLSRTILSRQLKKYIKKAGVTPLRVHDVRRTSATLTYMKHAGDKLVNQIVQTKLNHKRFDVTQKYIKIPKSVIKEHTQNSSISDILDFDNTPTKEQQSPPVQTTDGSDVEALKLRMKVLELELQLEQLRQKKAA